jgi:hypothetical protein
MGGLWRLMIVVVVAVDIMIGGSSAIHAQETIWTWSAGSWMCQYGCIEYQDNACVRHQLIELNTATGNWYISEW